MKTKLLTTILSTFVICAAVSFAVFNANDDSKSSIALLTSVEALADSECNKAGGPGSSSCSCTSGSMSGAGMSAGGDSCSVTIADSQTDSYYACCYKDKSGLCRCMSQAN